MEGFKTASVEILLKNIAWMCGRIAWFFQIRVKWFNFT